MSRIKGTNVAATIVPFDTNDIYPTHDEKYGLGGFRSVQTIQERNNIPLERRKHGMRVYVWGDGSSPDNNTDWEWDSIGGVWVKSKIIVDAESILNQAEEAAEAAEAAQRSTLTNTKIYVNTTEGLLAVGEGEYFNVISSDPNNYLDLYRKVDSNAVFQKSYPTFDAIEDLIYSVKNTLYVTKNGDDSNNGDALHSPLATIKQAFDIINARREASSDPNEVGYNPEPYVVIVHPGHYSVPEDTIIPRNTTLYGYDLRSTFLNIEGERRPANMFKMSNGIKVRGFTYLGMQHETQFDEGGDPSHNLKSSSSIEIGKRYKISTDGYSFSYTGGGAYVPPTKNWYIPINVEVNTPSSTPWRYFIIEGNDWNSEENQTIAYKPGDTFVAVRSGAMAATELPALDPPLAIGNGTVYDLDGRDYIPKKGWVFTFRENEFITRSPYLADCSQLHNFTYEQMSLPIDRASGNPDMPRGGGNMWADGSVLDKYSPLKSVVVDSFTAINPNGYGYLVDKNALVQLVSIFTNWSRYGIWANEGGHVTLANSNNTFGDYALVASGFRWIISLPEDTIPGIGIQYDEAAKYIEDITESLYTDIVSGETVPDNDTMATYATGAPTTLQSDVWTHLINDELNEISIITEMWDDFINTESFSYEREYTDENGITQTKTYRSQYSAGGYSDLITDYQYHEMWFDDYITLFNDESYGTKQRYEFHTKRDTKSLLNQLAYDLMSGQDRGIRFFANGVFDWDGTPFFLVNDPNLTSANEVHNKGLLNQPKYNANLWPSFRRCFIILYNILEKRSKPNGSTPAVAPELEPAMETIKTLISFLIDIFDDIFLVYAGDGSSPPVEYISKYRKGMPSTIEATGQQFSYSGTGVNYNSLPYAQRGSGVSPDPISTLLKFDGGQIFATFSSESGDTYLGEDLKVDFKRSTIEGQAFSRGVQNIALPLIIGVSG